MPHNTLPQSVLMVCLGNICRSPLAEEVFKQKSKQMGFSFHVDSCGTGGWHAGEQADHRSRAVAKQYGYDIDHQRSRQITESDFSQFDLMLAMDSNNLADITKMKHALIDKGIDADSLADIALFSEHDTSHHGKKVPDPYYGSMQDFEHAIDLIESMADGWLEFFANI